MNPKKLVADTSVTTAVNDHFQDPWGLEIEDVCFCKYFATIIIIIIIIIRIIMITSVSTNIPLITTQCR